MTDDLILIVEDNPDDELLILRALRQSNVANDTKVVRDGVEALDYLFCTGAYADRDAEDRPALILLDLKLPKIDGLEVLWSQRGFAVSPLDPLPTSRNAVFAHRQPGMANPGSSTYPQVKT